MNTSIRVDTQIKDTDTTENRIIGSKENESHWDSYLPDQIVKITYTVTSADLVVIQPDTQYLIPSITTAKEGDTAVNEDGKILLYKNDRWNTWSGSIQGRPDWGAIEW